MTNFKQKSKIGVAGSFFNQLMSNNESIPEVGKGATVMHYTDRTCYEVIEVSKDFKTVKLEALDAKIDPEYLASLNGKNSIGHQNWVFEPTGHFVTVVWKWGSWKTKRKEVIFTNEHYKKADNAGISVYKLLTPEQMKDIYQDNVRPQNVVEGITKEVFKYNRINILFGVKNYYYDWSF